MTTPTLSAYLPVLAHPEHGPAICRAVGVYPGRTHDTPNAAGDPDPVMLPDWWMMDSSGHTLRRIPLGSEGLLVAAISHGIAAWLANRTGGVSFDNQGPDGWCVWAGDLASRAPTLPAALLAAAERVLSIEHA